MRILLIEDEVALAAALKYILEKNHFQVDIAYDGLEGEDLAFSNIYDAFVLDRMLPGKEGVAILRTLREAGITTPAMFLTARDAIADRVEGLEAGADDYLIKPFSNQEFLARVRALTRRSGQLVENEMLCVQGLTLDITAGSCCVQDKTTILTRKEAQLLELLLRNHGITLKKEQILDRIWGIEQEVEIGNVDLYIFYLRKKIDFSKAGLALHTVRGIGYVLMEETHD